jgi:exonuclease III
MASSNLETSMGCAIVDNATSNSDCLLPSRSSSNTLRVATWNVRSASTIERRLNITNYLQKNKLDICLVQETKLTTQNIKCNGYNFYGSGNIKVPGTRQNGVGLFLKEELSSNLKKIS